jgi:hypothetical protein
VHGGQLVLYWDPAFDNTGIADYGYWVDGRFIRNFGATEFQNIVGTFTPDDTRVFQLDASDPAGNVGPFAPALTGVPLVVGKTQAAAVAALQSRGFRAGAITEEASETEPGLVIRQSPSSPGVANLGTSVDLVVSRQGGQAKLVMNVAAAHRVLLATRKFIALRVELSLPGEVTARLRDAKGRLVSEWPQRSLKAGATILRLNIPAEVRAGALTLSVAVAAAGQAATQSLPIAIVRSNQVEVKPIKPREVALVDGPDIRPDLSVNLKQSLSLVYTTAPNAFALAAAPRARVGAAVVDLTAGNARVVRDLRLVFPELRIVAVADTVANAARARAAGASIVLVKPASAAMIAAALDAVLRLE